MRLVTLCFGIFSLAGCASHAPSQDAPAWTQANSRTVDNGFIVYVGHAEAPNADRGEIKAEGVALEDLANECSFIPRGTRVENRYSAPNGEHVALAYVQVAVELQECD